MLHDEVVVRSLAVDVVEEVVLAVGNLVGEAAGLL